MKPVPTNSKYKTLMCRNINSPQGCSYGDRCQYAHSISELRTFVGQISQNQIENPNAQNQPAKQRNPLNYKTAKCRNFEQTGTCKYGSRCNFIHNDYLYASARVKLFFNFIPPTNSDDICYKPFSKRLPVFELMSTSPLEETKDESQ